MRKKIIVAVVLFAGLVVVIGLSAYRNSQHEEIVPASNANDIETHEYYNNNQMNEDNESSENIEYMENIEIISNNSVDVEVEHEYIP